jgi:hypothetical protein
MLIKQNRQIQAHPQSEFKNPFRDKLEGTEYLEVHQRLQTYTSTYDQTQYDRSPAPGVVDVFDSSGDSSVGRNMNFYGNHGSEIYAETRWNTNAAGRDVNIVKLEFETVKDNLQVVQARDSAGDNHYEFHRLTTIDPRTGQILSVVE